MCVLSLKTKCDYVPSLFLSARLTVLYHIMYLKCIFNGFIVNRCEMNVGLLHVVFFFLSTCSRTS